MRLNKYYLAGLLVLVLALAAFAASWWRERQAHERGKVDQRLEDLTRRDSSTRRHIDSISLRVDTVTRTAVMKITRWDTVTKKIPVPGTVESVYVDTLFAKLPDSVKVQVLRAAGNEVAKACSEVITTCRQFRDSAYVAFRQKDSLVLNWQRKYQLKPRRRCGPGGTVGYGVLLGEDGKVHRGFGGSAGLTCNF